jgi:cytochrome P450
VRRLATIAFTPRRVAAMEPLVRELTAHSVEKRLSSGRADLVHDLAWDLPALVIFRVLGIPDEDVARVKAGAESPAPHVGATERGRADPARPGDGGVLAIR